MTVSEERSVSDAPSPLSRRPVLAAVGGGPSRVWPTVSGRRRPGPTIPRRPPTPRRRALPPPSTRGGGSSARRWTPPRPSRPTARSNSSSPSGDGPIPTFYFEPSGLFVEPGATVGFVFATPDQVVTAFHPGLGRTRRLPDGAPALSSPTMTAGSYWLYRFETPGACDLYCPPHEPLGTVVRIVVGEASGPATAPASTDPVEHGRPRPPMPTAADVLNDDALAPENVVAAGSVAWAAVVDENKALRY